MGLSRHSSYLNCPAHYEGTPARRVHRKGTDASTLHPIFSSRADIRFQRRHRCVPGSLSASLSRADGGHAERVEENLREFDQEAIGVKYKGINKEPMDQAEAVVWDKIQERACSRQNAASVAQ